MPGINEIPELYPRTMHSIEVMVEAPYAKATIRLETFVPWEDAEPFAAVALQSVYANALGELRRAAGNQV